MIKHSAQRLIQTSVPRDTLLVSDKFTKERDEHFLHNRIVQTVLAIEPTATLLAVQLRHERLEMHDRVLVTEKPDNKPLLIIINTVELMLLHLLETLHDSFVYAEFRCAVFALRHILVASHLAEKQ